MKEHLTRMPFYKYSGNPHIRLTPIQKAVKNNIVQKFHDGTFHWESVACLCGSSDHACISETDRYGLPIYTVICTNCGLLRTNPRLSSESLQLFYSKYYRDLYTGPEYGSMEIYFNGMVGRGAVILRTIQHAIPNLNIAGKQVLEVGSSAGGNLMPFLKMGACVQGYDYDQRYLDYGNTIEPKLNLMMGGLAELATSHERFDIIILNHVLEHLPDPKEAISILKKSLNENGLLYIGVPGLMNPDYYFSFTKSFLGSLHIAHLYHFTKSSLESIMIGFRTLSMDDDIRAVFQRDDSVMTREIPSEYDVNITRINNHEHSCRSRFARLMRIMRELPALARNMLPPKLVALLMLLRGKSPR